MFKGPELPNIAPIMLMIHFGDQPIFHFGRGMLCKETDVIGQRSNALWLVFALSEYTPIEA